MDKFSDFVNVINAFILLFDELIPIEQKKLDAAVDNKVLIVEDCMNKEQAAILKMRGLEQKREQAQKDLDMDGFTFRQILEASSEEHADILKPLFDRLSQQVTMFQSISESAREMIELNLHTIQSSLSKQAAAKSVYSPTRKVKKDDDMHFTSRSV